MYGSEEVENRYGVSIAWQYSGTSLQVKVNADISLLARDNAGCNP